MAADVPHMRRLGEVHRAMAPSHFTYGSHAAMFVGFTPGIARSQEPFFNPKFGKIFKLAGSGFPGRSEDGIILSGSNIIEGFRNVGYATLGTGAVGWFNPNTPTGTLLTRSFDTFYYPGKTYALPSQLAWIEEQLSTVGERPVFLFLNVGETHVPYYFEGAPWERSDNPCQPFQTVDRSADCRYRQRVCLEYIDRQCSGLLEVFSKAMVIVTADHGDCWGEDGLWEHGISHEMTLAVPLIIHR